MSSVYTSANAAVRRLARPCRRAARGEPLEFIADGDKTILRAKGFETRWSGGKGLHKQLYL